MLLTLRQYSVPSVTIVPLHKRWYYPHLLACCFAVGFFAAFIFGVWLNQ